jgi:hypothetical protein
MQPILTVLPMFLLSRFFRKQKTTRTCIVTCKLWVNGAWSAPFDKLAEFHCFSTDHEEYENGPGLQPVAIVEYVDGKVEAVHVNKIRFITPLQE